MDDEGPQKGRRTARAILNALGERERSVGEITRLTGLSQPNVSNHLARLRQRGWVVARRQGREVHYSLARPPSAGDPPGTGRSGTHSATSPWDAVPPLLPALAADYLAALLRLDEPRAIAVAGEALACGYDWKSISCRVMAPALARVGELWAAGELTVAEEHAATAVTMRLQERLTAGIPRPARPVGRAVVAGVAGNLHALGLRIAADFLVAAGWEAHCLGPDVPAPDLLAMEQRLRPEAVLLGVTLADQLPALREAVSLLRDWRQSRAERPFRPLLVAGGRYFSVPVPPEPGVEFQGADLETLIPALTARLIVSRR